MQMQQNVYSIPGPAIRLKQKKEDRRIPVFLFLSAHQVTQLRIWDRRNCIFWALLSG